MDSYADVKWGVYCSEVTALAQLAPCALFALIGEPLMSWLFAALAMTAGALSIALRMVLASMRRKWLLHQ